MVTESEHEMDPLEKIHYLHALHIAEFGENNFQYLYWFTRFHKWSYEDLNFRLSFLLSKLDRLSELATSSKDKRTLSVFIKSHIKPLEERIEKNLWLPIEYQEYQGWVSELGKKLKNQDHQDLGSEAKEEPEEDLNKISSMDFKDIEYEEGECRFYAHPEQFNRNQIWVYVKKGINEIVEESKKKKDPYPFEPGQDTLEDKAKRLTFAFIQVRKKKFYIHIFDRDMKINTGVVYLNEDIAIESLIRNGFDPIAAKGWDWRSFLHERNYFTFIDHEREPMQIAPRKGYLLENWYFSDEFGWRETQLEKYTSV